MTTNEGQLNMVKRPAQGAGPIAPKEAPPEASISSVAEEVRQLYYLVSGEIVFKAEDEEIPHAVRANAVVMSNDGKFAVPQLARVQQTLQGTFHQRMGAEAKISVLDVVITAIIPLGEFTQSEFNTLPSTPVAPGIPVTDAPIEEASTIE